MEIVIFVLVVSIIGLLVLSISRILNSILPYTPAAKAENYDGYRLKGDGGTAWWEWGLIPMAIIVRILIGIFKLLVSVARGMGKN